MKCQFCDNKSELIMVEIEDDQVKRYVCGECWGVISEVAKWATENKFIEMQEQIDRLAYQIERLRESVR